MNKTGVLGEMAAVRYLRKKHYKILTTNYRCRFGEIDIICQKKGYIVFAEVKTRSENAIASPMEFVDAAKQKRLAMTASLYLSAHETELQPRFDVLEVFCVKGKIKSVKHLENAFDIY